MYAMALSSSALSFDGMDGNPAADTQIVNAFNSLANRAKGINDFTDDIGAAENIHGTRRSVGSVTSTWGETCSAKTVTALSKAGRGLPRGPRHWRHLQGRGRRIVGQHLEDQDRGHATGGSEQGADALKVKTLTASLAGGSARVEVPIPGKPGSLSTSRQKGCGTAADRPETGCRVPF